MKKTTSTSNLSPRSRKTIPNHEPTIANAPLKKKISFFSAMLIVVGSCIGSGIFFKSQTVLNNSGNSIFLGMVCWIFVAIAVLLMALALIEIASVRSDNLSILGWSRSFNSRFIYKMNKNYIFYLYTPIRGFFLPVYVVMAFQDAAASIYLQKGIPYNGFGTDADWAIIMVLALVITTYFIVTTAYSTRLANIQNWIITSVKFFPLVLAAIIGFVAFGMNGGQLAPGSNYVPIVPVNPSDTQLAYWTFSTFTPGFGFFIAASAILYAFDGFYTSAGIKSKMSQPQKSSMAILVGLIVVTIIYLTIAISMSIGSSAGNPQGLVWFFAKHDILWLYATFQMMIAIGIFGVANGYYLFVNSMMADLVYEGEVPFSAAMARHIAKKKNGEKEAGIFYNLFISIPFIIVLSIIGGLAYFNTIDANGVLFSELSNLPNNLQQIMGNLANNGIITYTYGSGVGSLYTFTDMVSSWSALFIFFFIALILYSGIKNRKKPVVATNKQKFFVPVAIIAMIFIAIPVVITFVEPFVNVFFLIPISNNAIVTGHVFKDLFIGRIMALIMMVVYWLVIIMPIVLQDMYDKKKYGSIENAAVIRVNIVRTILNLPTVKDYAQFDHEARLSSRNFN